MKENKVKDYNYSVGWRNYNQYLIFDIPRQKYANDTGGKSLFGKSVWNLLCGTWTGNIFLQYLYGILRFR